MGADDGGGRPAAVVVGGRVPARHFLRGVVILDPVAGVTVAIGQGVHALWFVSVHLPGAVGDQDVPGAVGVFDEDLDQSARGALRAARPVGPALAPATPVVRQYSDGQRLSLPD